MSGSKLQNRQRASGWTFTGTMSRGRPCGKQQGQDMQP